MKTRGTPAAIAVGLLLAVGAPPAGTTVAHADPGCCCDCGRPEAAGHAGAMHHGPAGMQDNAAVHGGHMHGHGAATMGHHGKMDAMHGRMDDHIRETRAAVAKLRAVEARMEALKDTDAAAFRAASLEHARLLTDLQEAHLKAMEGMKGMCGP